MRDRIAQQHDSVVIGLNTFRPTGALGGPKIFEPIIAANWTLAGQPVVGGGNLKASVPLLLFRAENLRAYDKKPQSQQNGFHSTMLTGASSLFKNSVRAAESVYLATISVNAISGAGTGAAIFFGLSVK